MVEGRQKGIETEKREEGKKPFYWSVEFCKNFLAAFNVIRTGRLTSLEVHLLRQADTVTLHTCSKFDTRLKGTSRCRVCKSRVAVL
jgi:hypothetical protein